MEAGSLINPKKILKGTIYLGLPTFLERHVDCAIGTSDDRFGMNDRFSIEPPPRCPAADAACPSFHRLSLMKLMAGVLALGSFTSY